MDLEYSDIGGVLGRSDGVYRGSVSTESGPWCLPSKGGGRGSKASSAVRGDSGGGSTTVCGRPIIESVQSVARHEIETGDVRTRPKTLFSFLHFLAEPLGEHLEERIHPAPREEAGYKQQEEN